MSPPHLTHLTKQILAAIITHHPFTHPPTPLFPGFTTPSLLPILSCIPSLLFLPPRSLGRQPPSSTRRHRSPVQSTTPTPTHWGDPSSKTNIFASVSLQFYNWAHTVCGFRHDELTCREMARVLVRAHRLKTLWSFLRTNEGIVTTTTITEVIKVLGQEGLGKFALAAFHRMKQLHCKTDAQCYNTVILALCKVGEFKKARFLLSQMELPGARVRPDAYTYTIFIGCYCRRGMETGCRKAIRRRIWEANHMFRHMKFNGFEPDVVTYNCLIDGLCKTYRIERARELFDEMLVKGVLPNRVTYNSFVRYYSVVNEADKAVEMMRVMVSRGHGVATCSSYTPIIHSLCESGRVQEARDLLVEMVNGGSTPREFTYKLVCNALNNAGEESLPMELRKKIEDAMDERYRRVMKVKPMMKGRNRLIQEDL